MLLQSFITIAFLIQTLNSGLIAFDNNFSLNNKNLFLYNYHSYGSTVGYDNIIKVVPDQLSQIGILSAKKNLTYVSNFQIDAEFNITIKENGSTYTEGAAIWLLREPHIYDKIGYDQAQALLYGGQQVFKGVGIFLLPKTSQYLEGKTSFTIAGIENKKETSITQLTLQKRDSIIYLITLQAKKCDFNLNQNKLFKLRIHFADDFLSVYTLDENDERTYCFSISETYEDPDNKQFQLSVSALNSKKLHGNVDLHKLEVRSDMQYPQLRMSDIDQEFKHHHLDHIIHSHKRVNLSDIDQIKQLDLDDDEEKELTIQDLVKELAFNEHVQDQELDFIRKDNIKSMKLLKEVYQNATFTIIKDQLKHVNQILTAQFDITSKQQQQGMHFQDFIARIESLKLISNDLKTQKETIQKLFASIKESGDQLKKNQVQHQDILDKHTKSQNKLKKSMTEYEDTWQELLDVYQLNQPNNSYDYSFYICITACITILLMLLSINPSKNNKKNAIYYD